MFTIVGNDFNWNFGAGDVALFPEGDIDFGILVGKSKYEENHAAFSGGSQYVSVSVPEGVPNVGELKVFVGRPFLGLPFHSYSFDGNEYTKLTEIYCDAYFEISIPLGHTEIFMLCGGDPANTVNVTIEGNGTVTPNSTQYIKDGESVKFIFEPDASSYLSKITVNGKPAQYSGHVLLLENVTEDIEIVCVFLPHESTEISRYQLPIIKNRAEVIVYVFAFVGLGCLIIYTLLRRTGKIKYKNEL